MEELIETLKRKRQEFKQAQEMLEHFEEELEKSEAYRNLSQAKVYFETIKEELQKADRAVREKALFVYATEGNKKPFDGVSVIIKKSLDYQPSRAIRWAAANDALNMLKLQKRTFEKHARSVLDTMPLEFVKVKEEPSVRISNDLGAEN